MGADSATIGMLQGKFPADTTDNLPRFIWMNIDPWDYQTAPLFPVNTLIHETGHFLGLYHNFEDSFMCPYGDGVSDTPQSNGEFGECNTNGKDSCMKQRNPLDYTNLMSYGNCEVGVKLTLGQYVRMRCTAEEHTVKFLTPLGDSAIADQPVQPPPQPDFGNVFDTSNDPSGGDFFSQFFGQLFGPTAAPATPAPTAAPTNSLTSLIGGLGGLFNSFQNFGNLFGGGARVSNPKLRCNGVAGKCIDATLGAQCAVDTLADRCPGLGANYVCCPSSASVTAPVTPLPGVGAPCIGVDGSCIDSDLTACALELVPGRCLGAAQVQCCPTVAPNAAGVPPAPRVEPMKTRPGVAVDAAHTIAFPVGHTVHVGDKVWVPLPSVLTDVRTYLYRSSIVMLPNKEELYAREVVAAYANVEPALGLFVSMSRFVNGQFVDRGDYVVIVKGLDAAGAEQAYVTTLITVDVASCALEASSTAALAVSFGLQRTADACASRNGTVATSADELGAGLVCCVNPLTHSAFYRRSNIKARQPSGLQVAWRGLTSFWGAPMTVTLEALPRNATAPVDLVLVSHTENVMAAPPVAVTLPALGASGTFTPNVANPGVFRLHDESLAYASQQFHVVSLPCTLDSGDAGYCQPQTPITDFYNVQTDASVVCQNGEKQQCAGLSVQGVKFACCRQAASALQKQAAYLMSLDDFDTKADAASSSSAGSPVAGIVIGVVFGVLVLAAIAALVYYVTVMRKRSTAGGGVSFANPAYNG